MKAVFIAIVITLFLPVISSAAEQAPPPGTCSCFCATPGGAIQPASATQVKIEECQKTCTDSKKESKFLLCTTKKDQEPKNNLRCFDQATCTAQSGDLDKEYQPPECPPKMYYCYPKGEPISLSVYIPVPGKEEPIKAVSNLSEYVGTFYNYLLGFSIFIAIVMLMAGGLQYVLGAGGGEIGRAKERMKHAIIGLVILFAATLLLQTVNPRITKLEPPTLPMVKRVTLPPKATSCSSYTEKAACEADAEKVSSTGCIWSTVGSGGCFTKSGLVGVNGGPCTAGSCTDGSKCVRSLPPGGGALQDVCSNGQVGSPCHDNNDCAASAYGSPTCVDYRCSGSTGTPQGGACGQTRECREGLECKNSICSLRASAAQGAACVTTNDCSSGLVCRNNACGIEPPSDNGGSCLTGSDCKSGAVCLHPGVVLDCEEEGCVCSDKSAGAPCFMNQNCGSNRCSRNTAPYTNLGICQ